MRAILSVLLLLTAGPAAAADGAQLFADQCAGCHTVTDASGDAGPSLKGVIWRKVASRADFAYSGALKKLGGSWSPSRLDAYLKESQSFSPGNGMYFALADDAQRKAIVDYLKSAR